MASSPGLSALGGAAGRRAALRDGLLFALAGVLPAVLAVTLGLRAVRNEEAALRREAVAETDAAAQRAESSLLAEVRRGEEALAAVSRDAIPPDPAGRRRLVASLAPPWAEPALLDARLSPQPIEVPSPSAPAAAPAEASPRGEAACRAAAAAVLRGTGAARAELAGCDAARTELGSFLVPVTLLGVVGQRPDDEAADVLVRWLERHADRLRPAEAAATREEIAASGLSAARKESALGALSGAERATARLAAALGAESARGALLRGPDRQGLVRWRGDGAVGVLRVAPDGSALGFVADATSLDRAIRASRAAGDDAIALQVVTSPPPPGDAPHAVAWLAPGLGVQATLRGGDDLASRARRSRVGLWVIAGGSAAVAMLVAAALFARLRAARRTSELRTSFAAAVSHELRTPIASIRMLAELLEDERGGDEHERKEAATAIARESRRLGETVSRLLAWSRMSAGQAEVVREEAALADVVGDATDVFLERHPDVRIERELDASVTLAIDSGLVQLAVMNLLENARKYAPEGQPYRVAVAATEGGARIEVEDRGPGVPRGARGRIFEPFERGDDRLSRATEGTGIGLALVRAAARAHGGDASFSPGHDGGARFTIDLRREES